MKNKTKKKNWMTFIVGKRRRIEKKKKKKKKSTTNIEPLTI